MATQKLTVTDFYKGSANVLAPHLLNGMYRRGVNLNLAHGTLKKMKNLSSKELIAASSTYKYYNKGDIVPMEDVQQNPVFFQGFAYILYNGIPQQLRGTTLIPTIVSSSGLNVIGISGSSSGDKHTYYVSWRNAAGFESPLVKIGEYFGYSLTISNVPTLSGSKVRLYRIGSDEVYITLVKDNLQNGALNKRFGTTVHSSPAKNNPPARFSHLQASKLGLIASAGSTLYISELRPDAFDTLASLSLAGEITGIASIDVGIMVFTSVHYLYIISGTRVNNIRVSIVSTDIGCDSHNTIARLRNGIVAWVFENDIYTFNNGFNNITRGKYKVEFTGNAVSFKDRYIVNDNNNILAVDFGIPTLPFITYEFNVQDIVAYKIPIVNGVPTLGYYSADKSFRTLDWGTTNIQELFTRFGLGGYGNVLPQNDESLSQTFGTYPTNIVDKTSEYVDLDVSTSLDTTYNGIYHSGDFYAITNDSETVFNAVDIVYRGKLKVTLYVDNNVVAVRELERAVKGVDRVNFPASSNRGSFCAVAFTLDDEVYNYSISVEATPIP